MSSLKIQSLFHKAHGLLVRQGCLKCALIETFSHKSSQQKIERTDAVDLQRETLNRTKTLFV